MMIGILHELRTCHELIYTISPAVPGFLRGLSGRVLTQDRGIAAMRFSKNMYSSPRIRDPRQIERDLRRGKGHLTIYVLTLSRQNTGKPVLEIMHCANLQQSWYREHPPLVVGIAEGRQDAFELVRAITQEAFDRTGQWDAAAYLQSVPGHRERMSAKKKSVKKRKEKATINAKEKSSGGGIFRWRFF